MRNRRTRLAIGLSVVLCITGLSVLSASAAHAADRIGTIKKRTGTTVSIDPGLDAKATARCRRGETLIGGGALVDGTSFNTIFLRASGPDPGNARRWLAHGYNNDGVAHEMTAYAMCAKSSRRDRVGVIVRSVAEATDLAAGTSGNDTASCRSGERLAGGGAAGSGTPATSALLTVSAPDPSATRRWLATAYNNSGTTQTLRATAFCARAARPDKVGRIVKRAGARITLAASSAGTATAACRRGERLVGGGAIGEGGPGIAGVLLSTSAPQAGNFRRWRAAGFNFDAVGQDLRAFALCAK